MTPAPHQNDSSNQWTCPLCTLHNEPQDDRCAACDNVRTFTHDVQKYQPLKPPVAVATAPQQVVRSCQDVCFSSLPSNQWTCSAAPAACIQNPRHTATTKCKNGRWNVRIDGENNVKGEHVMTETRDTNTDITVIEKSGKEDQAMNDIAHEPYDTTKSMVMTRNDMESEEDEETMIEEPCFNLLEWGTTTFHDPVIDDQGRFTAETRHRDESKKEVDVKEKSVVVLSSSSQYSSAIPASKMCAEELSIDEKLASAGLELSDSDEEEKGKEPLLQGRQGKGSDASWKNKWICQICTSLNQLTALDCSICSSKRYMDNTLRESDTSTGSHLTWACHICSNLNPPDSTDCLMCLSTKTKSGNIALHSCLKKEWACLVCTTLNDPETSRCEVCDCLREEELKNSTGKGWECTVCTNTNSPSSTRCEICETCLPTDDTFENHVIDLSFSPADDMASYSSGQPDHRNRYGDLSKSKTCDAFDTVVDLDTIEEISDHEPSMSLIGPRPLKVRPELMKFEHFVCVEDLRSDDGCRINYNKMFAGQRSGKSYADRIAKRQAQSRKRKQDAARKEAQKTSTPTSQGEKAVRTKRKLAAAQRRGGNRASRTKKAKKAGVSARAVSSTTTYAPAINHYDDSMASLGEDLSTMAWEGIGSAGYI